MHIQKPDKQQNDADPELLQKALHQLLEQISKRDQKIAERDALLFHTQRQLKEKESELHKILTSRAWKILLFFRRLRILLISPGSRRTEMLRRGLDIIFSPFKKIGRN
jgi:hypothetical protein